MEEEFVPIKTLFQFYVLNGDEVVYDGKVVAYDEQEAIIKAKIGTIVAANGLADDDVEIICRAVGYLNESANQMLADKPPITEDDLPASNIIARIKSIVVSAARPMVCTRKFAGVDFDIACLVTENIKDQYAQGDISVGDYVIVTYCEHDYPDQPIVTSKVYRSW